MCTFMTIVWLCVSAWILALINCRLLFVLHGEGQFPELNIDIDYHYMNDSIPTIIHYSYIHNDR